MNLKKKVFVFILCISLMIPKSAKADLFGGDVAVLLKILTQSIQQLYELKQILGTGKAHTISNLSLRAAA